MTPSPEQEFGSVTAVELKRLTQRGAMKPLLCRADDDRHYILKPHSVGRSLPLAIEWICARLGRALGLPIPNYRKIEVSPELAREWNEFNERQIEAGLGFGSQQVVSAMEFEVSLAAQVPEDLRLRILAFDWWIRNHDRGERNPNLLWNATTRSVQVIDHDQAGYPEDASIFWSTHLFKSSASKSTPWLPPELAHEFASVASDLLPTPILGELPSEWTTAPDGIGWFVRHLNSSLNDTSHRDWRSHE